jgi:hypothetical protein
MSLVFKAKINDLPYEKDGEKRNAKGSTVKLMLLAYADHANDEGEGAYPGYDKLEIKTALSRQGIADTIEAIKQNDLMTFEGVSKWGTNSYKINKNTLQGLVKPLDSDESSHLTQTSQATRLKPSVKPKKQPSIKEAAKPKPPTPPEIQTFREVTNRYPPKNNWEDVAKIIQSVSARLGRLVTANDLRPFFNAWTLRGFKPTNILWTSWAVTGIIPERNPQTNKPKAFDAVGQWQTMKGVIHGD